MRAADGVEAVEAAARASLEKMGVASGDVLLVRDSNDLLGANGPALWDRLRRLKDEGLYAGASVTARKPAPASSSDSERGPIRPRRP